MQIGEEESVRAVIQSVGIFGDSYRSIDSKFQVSSQLIAKYSIVQVLNGLVGQALFGTGFPLIKRRYPVIELVDDMVVVYDPSEP